jgi:hypothetical protein
MAKKKAARPSTVPLSAKRLRRKLEKLEARHASAADKRDRAQARVDALAILVEEARASLAAAESPASKPPAAKKPTAAPTAKPTTASATARARRTSRVTGTRSTRASSRPTPNRTRRRPSSDGGAPSSGGSI